MRSDFKSLADTNGTSPTQKLALRFEGVPPLVSSQQLPIVVQAHPAFIAAPGGFVVGRGLVGDTWRFLRAGVAERHGIYGTHGNHETGLSGPAVATGFVIIPILPMNPIGGQKTDGDHGIDGNHELG